ncbi:MAG: cysteinyl-tRNA synthetase [Chloroflexia bacterium]
MDAPSIIAVLGSGETSPSGRKAHDYLMSRLQTPVRTVILETPAGFQPNVDYVARKVADFVEHSLQNYKPEIEIIAARKKGSEYDPDDPAIVDAILGASYIFAGAGSPTYFARHLKNTRAEAHIRQRLREGAVLTLASAAAIAGGGHAIPVYEMFKVGDDPYWAEGLDIFSEFGLDLVIVPHWNNKEGGEHLDTSRCYIGLDRFEYLRNLLPASAVIVGVDENTACIFEFSADEVRVIGKGSVTILHGDDVRVYNDKETFSVSSLRTAQPATSQG